MLLPTKVEQVMGLIIIGLVTANIYYKSLTQTVIFMFNPCHFTAVMLAYVSLTPFSRVSEMVALYVYSNAFGGWIGIIFSENHELSMTEQVIYYV